jgi:ribosomal protein S18 acetylase RimI-like enzyme
MTADDLPQILDVEQSSFDCPWRESLFRKALQAKNNIGIVHDSEFGHGDGFSVSIVSGYMIYSLDSLVEIQRIAIAEPNRRRGIGSLLIMRLIKRFSKTKKGICVTVDESNLAAQLFFSHHGFQATNLIPSLESDSLQIRMTLLF